MQVTSFKTQAEFNEAMRLAHLNDNPFGILGNIYDNEYPHPYFDPDKIGFYRYRNYNHQQYTSRDELPDKSIVFEDFEMYIPSIGDPDHKLAYDVEQCPLTERDYVITSCITKNDHMWPVPYVYNNYHFVRTHEVNKNQIFAGPPSRLYIADVLLGNPKNHRNIFFKFLRAHNMLDDCIVNLFGIYKSKFLEQVDDNIQTVVDGAEQRGGYINTTNLINGNFVSQYISMPIMNASWYSIVGETISNNDCFFVTEKTAKPMMAGRPFIILSGKHTLKYLRSIGFKTFASIIDESYDEIDNEYDRISAAFASFQALAKLDPIEVYKQLGKELQHNQKIMQNKQALTQRARDFLDDIRLDYM